MKKQKHVIDYKENLRILMNYMIKYMKKGKKCIGFTSCVENQGKTRVVKMVGEALMNIGFEVLVVDGNTVSPALSKMYQGSNQEGIIELIKKQKEEGISLNYEEVLPYIKRDEETGLYYLLRGGNLEEVFSEYIEEDMINKLFSILRKEFDVILVETASAEYLSYAQSFLAASDGYFLIIKPGTVPLSKLPQVKEKLTTIQKEIFGAIFSQRRNP